MKVDGDYSAHGYATVRQLIPPEVAATFLHRLHADLAQSGVTLARFTTRMPLLTKDSIEIYGYLYKPMISFLWGLTPAMATLTGRDLLPSYSYFRIYQEGDVCQVHSDREACEHSLSLTMGYSDGRDWEFDIGSKPLEDRRPPEDGFGSDPYSTVRMKAGDAVLYRGVERRHGRTQPNPNRWSAHMFLHWVDRDGPYRSSAFDGKGSESAPPDFNL